MKDILLKDTLRSIKRNRLRFISVAIIVALGISFYIGIKSASPKMNTTANNYFNEYNLTDVRVASRIPFTDEDINRISKLENVDSVVKSRYVDAIVRIGNTAIVDNDGMELSCRVSEFDCAAAKAFTESGTADSSYVNRLKLIEGRYPEKINECVIDSYAVENYDDIEIGSVITLNGDGASILDTLKVEELTVVGTVDSPMYISSDRGTTQVGSGKLSTFLYVDSQSFSTSDINELFVEITDSADYDKFGTQYDAVVTELADEIKEMSTEVIDSKLSDIKADYNAKITEKEAEIKAYEASSTKELNDKKTEIETFKAYVNSENELYSNMTAENEANQKSAKSARDSAKTSYEKICTSYDENSRKLESQSQKIDGYSELKELYDDLNTKHLTDKQSLDKLKSAADSAYSEMQSAETALGKATASVKSAENKISELKEKNKALQSEITSLQSDKSTQQNKIDTLNYDIKAIQEDIDAINAKIDAGTADMADRINLSTYNSNLSKKNESLKSAKSALADIESDISAKESEITKNNSSITSLNNGLSSLKSKVTDAQSTYDVKKTAYNGAKENYDTAKASYDTDSATLKKYQSSMDTLTSGQSAITELQKTVEKQKTEVENAKVNYTVAQLKYSLTIRDGANKISELKTKLSEDKVRYDTIDDEYTELKKEVDEKLNNLNGDLKTLKNTLKNVESITWNTTGQTNLSGHSSFITSMENINSMSTIFPLIFLFTAMIASFVIMLKNVEDERNAIGLFKAFGYSSVSITAKFLVYSTAAWLLGSILGVVIGSCVLPGAIYSIYGSIFNIPDIYIAFNARYIFRGLAVSFVTTTAASVFAVIRELKNNPAVLMRPKAISYNRRSLIERIPELWKRLPYGIVIFARTISRSRKRVIVGTITIACCTALVLSALGLLNSASDVKDAQYGEDGIFCYDMQFVLNAGQEPDDSVTLKSLKENRNVDTAMLLANVGYDVSSQPSRWRGYDSAHIIVPNSPNSLSDYIHLNVIDGSASLDGEGAVISEKMAEDLELNVGDTAYFTNTDGDMYSAQVTGIVENYISHYVYMSEQTYKDTFYEEPEYKYILSNLKGYLTDTEIATLSAEYLKTDEVTGTVTSEVLADSVDISINQVLALVIMFVAAAFVLATIVMYTISNVNISERTHEIANIKVIGFNDGELLFYVIRENIVSTAVGIVVGLIGGVFLNIALINYISVENVMYGHHIYWWSFIAAMLIIVLVGVAAAVPIMIKINRVNVPETLKAIE